MSTSERFDPSRRRLCPDGACIGVLDESGRCRECGRTFAGGGELAGPVATPAGAADSAAPDPAEPVPAPWAPDETRDGDAGTDGARFDPRRRLCPDGACIGVVDPATGQCRVCGAHDPAEAASA